MDLSTLMVCLLLLQSPQAQPLPAAAAQPSPSPNSGSASIKSVASAPEASADLDQMLLRVKRIYVESFGDDLTNRELQAMVVSALTASKRFIVTENKEKADAVLKGSALEKTTQEFHALGEGTGAASAAGYHSGSVSGSVVNGNGSISGSSSGGFGAHALSAQDSVASTETINDARLAVRLVSPDGDVLWATTQESKAAKYRSSAADAADKAVKQLLHDVNKAQKGQAALPAPVENRVTPR